MLSAPTARTAVVSAEHGVVRLSFDTAEQAEAARKALAASGQVENLAPNFLYRPALSMHWKEVESAPNVHSYFMLPFDVSRAHRPGHGSGDDPTNGGVPTPGLPDVMAPVEQTAGLDPLAAKDWALTSIQMPSVEQLASATANAHQIIAAVIDTGVDYNHEDLVDALWRNPADGISVGYDFAHNNSKPWDNVHFDIQGCLADSSCKLGIGAEQFLTNPGHGTHCAGHVGAVANNSVGIRGIGAGVQVMGLKFFYDFGETNAGSGDDAASIKAIDFAIKNGVRVVSASWGGREQRADAESSELKNALQRAHDAGVLVVIAAGNDGIDQDSVADPSYPAAYTLDNLLVVAAVDQNDGLASFSNFGATTVHIAAPGVKILSSTADGSYNDVVATFTDSSGKSQEMDWDGTSMATPIVAGAAALLWSAHPDWNYSQIRNQILTTARTVPGLQGKVSSGGVLNVSAMLAKQ